MLQPEVYELSRYLFTDYEMRYCYKNMKKSLEYAEVNIFNDNYVAKL